MEILNKPDQIFLQIDDKILEDPLDFEDLYHNGVSWCADKIFKNDIPYYSTNFINWLLRYYFHTGTGYVKMGYPEIDQNEISLDEVFKLYLEEK